MRNLYDNAANDDVYDNGFDFDSFSRINKLKFMFG